MSEKEDIASLAGQLATLTRAVEEMAEQLKSLREGAQNQQDRSDTQQERIELAAKELTDVSDRLQLAANALRASI
jgi:methyl-accepting chemotaxis protein